MAATAPPHGGSTAVSPAAAPTAAGGDDDLAEICGERIVVGGAEGGAQREAPRPGGKPGKNARYKTRLCIAWQEEGSCRQGSACAFAHGERELHVPDTGKLRKNRMCPAYAKHGKCALGQGCELAHGMEELRPSRADMLDPDHSVSKYKTKLCKMWGLGQCNQGENCRWAHGEQELRKPGDPLPADTPCTSAANIPLEIMYSKEENMLLALWKEKLALTEAKTTLGAQLRQWVHQKTSVIYGEVNFELTGQMFIRLAGVPHDEATISMVAASVAPCIGETSARDFAATYLQHAANISENGDTIDHDLHREWLELLSKSHSKKERDVLLLPEPTPVQPPPLPPPPPIHGDAEGLPPPLQPPCLAAVEAQEKKHRGQIQAKFTKGAERACRQCVDGALTIQKEQRAGIEYRQKTARQAVGKSWHAELNRLRQRFSQEMPLSSPRGRSASRSSSTSSSSSARTALRLGSLSGSGSWRAPSGMRSPHSSRSSSCSTASGRQAPPPLALPTEAAGKLAAEEAARRAVQEKLAESTMAAKLRKFAKEELGRVEAQESKARTARIAWHLEALRRLYALKHQTPEPQGSHRRTAPAPVASPAPAQRREASVESSRSSGSRSSSTATEESAQQSFSERLAAIEGDMAQRRAYVEKMEGVVRNKYAREAASALQLLLGRQQPAQHAPLLGRGAELAADGDAEYQAEVAEARLERDAEEEEGRAEELADTQDEALAEAVELEAEQRAECPISLEATSREESEAAAARPRASLDLLEAGDFIDLRPTAAPHPESPAVLDLRAPERGGRSVSIDPERLEQAAASQVATEESAGRQRLAHLAALAFRVLERRHQKALLSIERETAEQREHRARGEVERVERITFKTITGRAASRHPEAERGRAQSSALADTEKAEGVARRAVVRLESATFAVITKRAAAGLARAESAGAQDSARADTVMAEEVARGTVARLESATFAILVKRAAAGLAETERRSVTQREQSARERIGRTERSFFTAVCRRAEADRTQRRAQESWGTSRGQTEKDEQQGRLEVERAESGSFAGIMRGAAAERVQCRIAAEEKAGRFALMRTYVAFMDASAELHLTVMDEDADRDELMVEEEDAALACHRRHSLRLAEGEEQGSRGRLQCLVDTWFKRCKSKEAAASRRIRMMETEAQEQSHRARVVSMLKLTMKTLASTEFRERRSAIERSEAAARGTLEAGLLQRGAEVIAAACGECAARLRGELERQERAARFSVAVTEYRSVNRALTHWATTLRDLATRGAQLVEKETAARGFLEKVHLGSHANMMQLCSDAHDRALLAAQEGNGRRAAVESRGEWMEATRGLSEVVRSEANRRAEIAEHARSVAPRFALPAPVNPRRRTQRAPSARQLGQPHDGSSAQKRPRESDGASHCSSADGASSYSSDDEVLFKQRKRPRCATTPSAAPESASTALRKPAPPSFDSSESDGLFGDPEDAPSGAARAEGAPAKCDKAGSESATASVDFSESEDAEKVPSGPDPAGSGAPKDGTASEVTPTQESQPAPHMQPEKEIPEPEAGARPTTAEEAADLEPGHPEVPPLAAEPMPEPTTPQAPKRPAEDCGSRAPKAQRKRAPGDTDVRATVSSKLAAFDELEAEDREVLTDVVVSSDFLSGALKGTAEQKHRAALGEDLEIFLGEQTEHFLSWLAAELSQG